MSDPTPPCPVCGNPTGNHGCSVAPASSPHDTPYTCDCEHYRRATHALDEAHGMLKDARAELAALKGRLRGLLKQWRTEHEDSKDMDGYYDESLVKCAADLEKVLGDG